MVLMNLLGDLLKRPKTAPPPPPPPPPPDARLGAQAVLNVGGGTKRIGLPPHYASWRHVLLDIQANEGVDVVCDARQLHRLAAGTFDAVYCSHNLEHYYKHELASVLAGFSHVLKDDGFVEIRVPDIQGVIQHVVRHGVDLHQELYRNEHDSFSAHDVIYGWGKQIENLQNDFFAHKTGFTPSLMGAVLHEAGFVHHRVMVLTASFELWAFGFKSTPTHRQCEQLGLLPA